MAITTAQRNAGAYQLLVEMATEFPSECDAMAWIIVRAVKNGNATQKEVAKALMNSLVQAKTGQDMTASATLRHGFKHYLYDVIQRFVSEHPGLTSSDAFNAESVTVS